MSETTYARTSARPCWIRPGEISEEYHYPSRDAALAPDDPNNEAWTPLVVEQRDRLCVTVPCVCCGDEHDKQENSVVHHYTSVEEAERRIAKDGWTRTEAGWKCRLCGTGACGCHVGGSAAKGVLA